MAMPSPSSYGAERGLECCPDRLDVSAHRRNCGDNACRDERKKDSVLKHCRAFLVPAKTAKEFFHNHWDIHWVTPEFKNLLRFDTLGSSPVQCVCTRSW